MGIWFTQLIEDKGGGGRISIEIDVPPERAICRTRQDELPNPLLGSLHSL